MSYPYSGTEDDDAHIRGNQWATDACIALISKSLKTAAWQLVRDFNYDREDLINLIDEALLGE